MSYVALAGTVISAGAGIAGSFASKGGGGGSATNPALKGGYQPLKLPDVPKPIEYAIPDLFQLGKNYDIAAYSASDLDFRKRHGPIRQAEKIFEGQVLKDQQGDSELMPALQNEYLRAGLQGALSSFGSTSGTLAPGSAGEASVARNLGLSIAGYQDRNRQNRQQSLLTAEQIFPRRSFGFGGEQAVGISMANTQSENAYEQAQHAQDVQLLQYNAQGQAQFGNAQQAQANVNGQAAATNSATQGQGIASAAQILGKGIGQFAGSSRSMGSAIPASTYAGWKPATLYPGQSTTNPGTYYVPQ